VIGATNLLDLAVEILPAPGERAEVNWRADPADGLRPLRRIRKRWRP
jgi:hypothetical protein